MSMAAPVQVADRPFLVQLDAFSGPLDLLLHLIREQEIDIADIPIGRIADQFLAAIHQLGLNEAADYLEMAAYLLRIKVAMLLPRPLGDDEWEDPRAELVRRLLEYEQIREIADWVSRQAGERSDRFARGLLPEAAELPPPPLLLDLQELLATAERLVEGLPGQVLHRVVPRPLDTEGATLRIRELLATRERFDLLELLGSAPTVTDVISCLIALLELARLGELIVSQDVPFGSVAITRAVAHEAH
ncbi:MAG TPA: segregation/condensation protein A [Gemmatimonadales bacterium]|nr:segregation/condensation protein A [Gemmatimonadales bacterium]